MLHKALVDYGTDDAKKVKVVNYHGYCFCASAAPRPPSAASAGGNVYFVSRHAPYNPK